jgi:ribosome maturation factor RimP
VHAATAAQQVRQRLEPLVAAAGYDLEDLVVAPAGRRRLVRVVVDKDGGVSLDECAEVSRLVSAALDADDEILGPGAYTLEVSSPGVGRPLTQPRHWRRSHNRLVRVARVDGSVVVGRVVDSDDTRARLRVEGDIVEVPYVQVRSGVVQVELAKRADEERADEERADEERADEERADEGEGR